MKLANFKRIFYTDFPQQYQQVIEQLSYTINNGFQSLYAALNNNISIRDNFFASVRDVTLTVDATGNVISGGSFSVDNSNPIEGTTVLKAINNGSNAFPTSGIFLTYSQSGQKVTITNATGIPASISFTIRVIAYLA